MQSILEMIQHWLLVFFNWISRPSFLNCLPCWVDQNYSLLMVGKSTSYLLIVSWVFWNLWSSFQSLSICFRFSKNIWRKGSLNFWVNFTLMLGHLFSCLMFSKYIVQFVLVLSFSQLECWYKPSHLLNASNESLVFSFSYKVILLLSPPWLGVSLCISKNWLMWLF